jgi:phenylpropionate dioxygenase-like ring-hydroxylating dioxygenase large terminal subunit
MVSYPEEKIKADSLNSSIATPFNWRNCWYPISFIQDLPSKYPYKFTIYDQDFVLFKNQEGILICLKDVCPHRGAKLSDGQIIDGKIECLYHGWQFGTDGKCLHIPQLPEKAKIPENSRVKSYPVQQHQGMIWVWLGDADKVKKNPVPHLEILENTDIFCVDTVLNLPYDYSYLIENFLDPAHVAISHDRSELIAKREDAQPLEMEILESSGHTIKARYRKNIPSQGAWTNVDFYPPYCVIYSYGNPAINKVGGFALYAIPIQWGKSRLFVRRYGTIFTSWFKLKPVWLEHLRQNKIIEEDLDFIVAQQEVIEKTKQSLKELFLPLKSSDLFLLEYRKWLDKYGQDLPFYEGYTTAKHIGKYQADPNLSDRLSRHTKLCHSCSQAHKNTQTLTKVLVGVAIFCWSLALLTDNLSFRIIEVLAAILAVILAAGCYQVKLRFEQSYHRH